MANYVIIADWPSFDDPEKQFRGAAGRYVHHLLKSANAPTRDMAIEFLYESKRDMYAGYNRFNQIIAKHKPRVVLAMGQTVFKEFDLGTRVSDCRGSVYTVKKHWGPMYVVPTYGFRELQHPHKMYAEEPMAKGVYTLNDIRRSAQAYREGWNLPPENFNVNPTLQEVLDFVDDSIRENRLLGTDIEGTGLNIEHTQIVVLGFAWSESDAIVIPFLKENGEQYWSRKEWNIVANALKRLMKHCRFMFQNGVGYDVPLLRARGWPFAVERMWMDTMVMDHAINPEFKHNIGDISSRFGKQPYWKESFLDRGEHIFETDQEEMKIYNARDCVALHQIFNGMSQHIDVLMANEPLFNDTWKIIHKSMREAQAVVLMEESGLYIDRPRYRKWVSFLEKELNTVEDTIRTKHSLPPSFSLSSPDHKRFWLYHEQIGKLNKEKLNAELATYDHEAFNYQYECSVCGRKRVKKYYPDLEEIPSSFNTSCPGCKSRRPPKFVRTDKERTSLKARNKDTNKYRELIANVELANIELLPYLKGYKPLQTDSGASALDKDAIVRYQIAIHRRLDDIKHLRRRRPSHDIEEKDLQSLVETLDLLKKYVKYKKLQDSFTSKLLDKARGNGKIYPHFMVTGTATGRLSCKNPNAQQIPSGDIGEMIRGCFKAGPGNEFMSIDKVKYSSRFKIG